MRHKKILLVDDDEDDQLIFTDAIAELTSDLECLVASNGYEALTRLKEVEEAPSVIFLDLNMPIMNGFEFLDMLRCMHQLKDIPVVVFTTSNDPIDQERSKQYGVKKFFTKTADFSSLKAKLSVLLNTDMTFEPAGEFVC